MNADPKVRFVKWVMERERLRTTGNCGDPILQRFRFCNVNREHDRVTKWVHRFVRTYLTVYPDNWSLQEREQAHAVAIMFFTRVVNEPTSLMRILGPLMGADFDRCCKLLDEMSAKGSKVMRGAYMVTSCGTVGVNAWQYATTTAKKLLKIKVAGDRLSDVATAMQRIDGAGDFLTNQVCTDLRYVGGGGLWRDWSTFVIGGNGTRRGLSRWFDQPIAEGRPVGKFASAQVPSILKAIRNELRDRELFSDQTLSHFKDINNLSNCFCEFDKYERARWQIENSQPVTIKRYTAYGT